MIPGWLIHGDLPPVGNPISWQIDEIPFPTFNGYTSVGVQSGTAALALGLLMARQRRADIHAPTVIVPAYGCPDLIAAAEYAGVRPLLVDTAVDDPGYDLGQLASAIDARTIAIVAINFLGIRERLAELRAIVAKHAGVTLIEDNAQWFPEPGDGLALIGDLVCLSFGRGKPVSLLGGGLLLIRNDLDVKTPARAAARTDAALRTKTNLLNLLLHPRLYALVNRNPLLKIGETRFKALSEIRMLDARRAALLRGAVTHNLSMPRNLEDAWLQAITRVDDLYELNVVSTRRGRLLRYPVLASSADIRNDLWTRLDRAGLGVSAMYRNALPEVNGVAGKFDIFRDYVNAQNFAARLLTLPVHQRVPLSAIARMESIAKIHT